MNQGAMVVYALIACHNRRELTLKSIQALMLAVPAKGFKLQVILFDDGSTDGTAQAVSEKYPEAHIIAGDGTAYWARSMASAETYALNVLRAKETDYLLWLNDDVVLANEALSKLIETNSRFPASVTIGAVANPKTGEMTYSGFRRYGKHALHLAKVTPEDIPIQVDSFNGNVVLVPVSVAKIVGGIDGSYSHAWADLDYGFRCQKVQTPLILAPGYAGMCPPNEPSGRKSIWVEWKTFLGPKGAGNYRSLRKILRLHSKVLWIPELTGTYALWWGRAVLLRLRQTQVTKS